MLGIRRYKKKNFDLWAGDPKDFHTDFQISAEDSNLEAQISSQKIRHLALTLQESSLCKNVFEHLKSLVDQAKIPEEVKRITFIAPTVEFYEKAQEDLFQTFPTFED